MVRIIESLQDNPIRFLFKDSLYFPDPGMIVSLNYGVAQICTGNNPFGIIGSYPDNHNLISVYYDTVIFETNMVEANQYLMQDKLYCSNYGKFTNKKPFEDSLLLGFVKEVKENNLVIELI